MHRQEAQVLTMMHRFVKSYSGDEAPCEDRNPEYSFCALPLPAETDLGECLASDVYCRPQDGARALEAELGGLKRMSLSAPSRTPSQISSVPSLMRPSSTSSRESTGEVTHLFRLLDADTEMAMIAYNF